VLDALAALDPLEAALVLLAGLAAGTINTIVGSGTLITFPTLVAVGLTPVQANVTNTVGLCAGSVTGAWGYRRELAGNRRLVTVLSVVGVLGGAAGAVLLLVLPARAFNAIVPVLIGLGCLLVVVQPMLRRRLAQRRDTEPPRIGPLLVSGMALSSTYGGYFGAAQGVLHIALLTTLAHLRVQAANAAKNVISGLVNLTAAVLFALVSDVQWVLALVVAVGAALGGVLGARVGRRLPDWLLRLVIVVVGVVAIVSFVR
jgi:uncharacterized membrane protein YfcA